MSDLSDTPLMRKVEPFEVSQAWQFVEPGLQEIIRQCPTVPWTPVDVRRCLWRGEAVLYVHEDGFVIVQRSAEPISGAPYLNVWAMWFRAGAASPFKAQLIEWIDQTCRATCCEWWEGTSTREGWGRALYGVCDVAMVTWRRRP